MANNLLAAKPFQGMKLFWKQSKKKNFPVVEKVKAKIKVFKVSVTVIL